MNYQPKGSMCASCVNKNKDCSWIPFSEMPVIGRVGSTKIVRCMLFRSEAEVPFTENEECFCDRIGLGKPGVTCGDCPRDYKPR